jgi:hypothetical protein
MNGGGRLCGGADRDKVVVGPPPCVSPAQASDAGRASGRPDSSITDKYNSGRTVFPIQSME